MQSGLKSGECSVGPVQPRPDFPANSTTTSGSKSMGKRELLLVVGFLIVGAVVYHVSAPPPAPGEQSVSIGQLFENFRRHVRGNRASAELTTTSRYTIDMGVSELRVNSRTGALTIIGENR